MRHWLVYIALLVHCMFTQVAVASDNRSANYSIPTTFHAIVIADTSDPQIGDAISVSKSKIDELFLDITSGLFVQTNIIDISGRNFQYSNIKQQVDELFIGSNDTVLLFYIGHGRIPESERMLPAMLFTDGQSLEFAEIVNQLSSKRPRLLIAIADACNTPFEEPPTGIFADRGRTIIDEVQLADAQLNTPELRNGYSRLFLESAGSIIASAASTGQVAFYNDEVGGVFTDAFVTAIRAASRHYRSRWGFAIHGQQLRAGFVAEDVITGIELTQSPNMVLNVVDLLNPLSLFAASRTEQNTRDGCFDYLFEGSPDSLQFQRCFDRVFGINDPRYFEQAGTLPDVPVPWLTERAVVNLLSGLEPDQASHEMIAISQRFYHGDGAFPASFDDAIKWASRSYEVGNVEAAGIIGDMMLYEFQSGGEQAPISWLLQGLDWYWRGYESGDARAGLEWAKMSAWYGQRRDRVEPAIPILLDGFANGLVEELRPYLVDLCERGYPSACVN